MSASTALTVPMTTREELAPREEFRRSVRRTVAVALAGSVGVLALAASMAVAFVNSGVVASHSEVMTRQMLAEVFAVHGKLGAPGPIDPDIPCMIEHCTPQLAACAAASALGDKCIETLQCNNKCSADEHKFGHNRAPGCSYLCEMTTGYTSPSYTKLIECVGERHQCLPQYPEDGKCLAEDSDAVQNITSMDQLEGDWWVIKGVNCGQVADGSPFKPGQGLPNLSPTKGLNYPGGYDWYPCQHERFVKSTGSDYPHPTTPWVNNITYCGGANGGLKQCTTPIIDTVANVTLSSPGVVQHLYTDAPLKPQFEHWKVMSWPHKDYVFVIWCGKTPLVTYNGGITLARNKRSLEGMPKYVDDNFRATAKKYGLDWDQMCPSDNVGCP